MSYGIPLPPESGKATEHLEQLKRRVRAVTLKMEDITDPDYLHTIHQAGIIDFGPLTRHNTLGAFVHEMFTAEIGRPIPRPALIRGVVEEGKLIGSESFYPYTLNGLNEPEDWITFADRQGVKWTVSEMHFISGVDGLNSRNYGQLDIYGSTTRICLVSEHAFANPQEAYMLTEYDDPGQTTIDSSVSY